MSDEREEPATLELTIPIDWVVPQDMVGAYANHLIAQAANEECNLYFFCVQPPILVGSNEEKQQQLAEMTRDGKKISAQCVAKVILTEASFRRFAKEMGQMAEQMNKRRPAEADLGA